MIRKAIWMGTVAGSILAFFLWIVESLTGIKVFTLLLNVDFLTVRKLPIILELLFHFIISWGICLIFVEILRKRETKSSKTYWIVAILLSSLAAISYFPLTMLAIKETPSVTDWNAIFYWGIGHLLYAIICVLCQIIASRNKL